MGTNKDPNVARWFAVAKHGSQPYGQHPYSYHLDDAVAEVKEHVLILPALRYFDHDLIVCATFLHDVIEDTKTTRDELDALFDPRIGDMVVAVSDGPGKNRKERKAGVYAAIRGVGLGALAVKLGDRLGNAKTAGLAKDPNSGMLQMYRKEQATFEDELMNDEGRKLFLAFAKIREYLGIS